MLIEQGAADAVAVPTHVGASPPALQHGGKRTGAGRKPVEPGGVDRAFRLYARHLDLIARWQQQHDCGSASEAVRQMIEAATRKP